MPDPRGRRAGFSPALKGGPLQRGNFNKMSAWPDERAAMIYQHQARGDDEDGPTGVLVPAG
jgi:hypothetical protein